MYIKYICLHTFDHLNKKMLLIYVTIFIRFFNLDRYGYRLLVNNGWGTCIKLPFKYIRKLFIILS